MRRNAATGSLQNPEDHGMQELKTAINIAIKTHGKKKDDVGVAYIWHPFAVATYCIDERAKITAILHDVIECSPITLDDLRAAGIGEDVVEAVGCLTQRKWPYGSMFNRWEEPMFAMSVDQVTFEPLEGERERVQKAYQEHDLAELTRYYKNIASNDIAIEVKLADLRDSGDVTRFPKDQQERAEACAKKCQERRELLLKIVATMTPEEKEKQLEALRKQQKRSADHLKGGK